MTIEYLTPAELHQLTGFARPTSQASWLKERALPHRLDGRRVIVSRVHVQAWLEGRTVVSSGLNLAAVK
jgi:hypothetical protein